MDIIVCPNCKQENLAAENVCTHCGFWLKERVDRTLLKTASVDLQFQIAKHLASQNLPPKLLPNEVAFRLIEANNLIKLTYTKAILLGRGDKSRTHDNHFVDLSNHNAYVLGMSRDHVQIKRAGGAYYIRDLRTSNGTIVNGNLLVPNESYPLENGAVIILGRLGLIFYYG